MASSVDTTLSDFKINSVASEEVLRQMEQAGLLEPNQIYMTPDDEGGGNYNKNWVTVSGVLTTNVPNTTIDLSSYLPSTSGDEMYEVALTSEIQNKSGSLNTNSYSAVYTDLLGANNNYLFICGNTSQVTQVNYKGFGSIIVPVKRYIYSLTSGAIDINTLKIIGYRRIR